MAIFLGGVTGCGNLTAGGAGEAEVFVAGDGQAAESAGGEAAPTSREAAVPAIVSHSFEGTVKVTLDVFAVGATEAATHSSSLTGGVRTVEVDVRGEFPVSLGTVIVPPGVYGGVRVVFTEIRAQLTAGLGDLPLLGAGEVVVDLGSSGALTVEREIVLALDEDDRLEVLIDLRAPVWIAIAAPLPPLWVVTAAQFEGALEIEAAVL
jgi:hypothetical protein